MVDGVNVDDKSVNVPFKFKDTFKLFVQHIYNFQNYNDVRGTTKIKNK